MNWSFHINYTSVGFIVATPHYWITLQIVYLDIFYCFDPSRHQPHWHKQTHSSMKLWHQLLSCSSNTSCHSDHSITLSTNRYFNSFKQYPCGISISGVGFIKMSSSSSTYKNALSTSSCSFQLITTKYYQPGFPLHQHSLLVQSFLSLYTYRDLIKCTPDGMLSNSQHPRFCLAQRFLLPNMDSHHLGDLHASAYPTTVCRKNTRL